MTACQVVDILLGEDEYYYAFNGNPHGYLGTVDADCNVKATTTGLHDEHQDFGMSFHDARWRYATNRKVPLVGWSNECTEQQKEAVTSWLEERGHPVEGHVFDLSQWFWPTGLRYDVS
jgi:hypothetical protein